MHSLRRAIALAILPGMLRSMGCAAKVLPSEPSDGSPPPTGDGPPTRPTTTLAVDRGATIETLTDHQATALCDWLVGEFESVDQDPVQKTSSPSGYAAGPSLGCDALTWPGIPTSDCVLNLRANPCTGTVGDLAQCITYFASTHDIKTDPTGACPDLARNCDAFIDAPSCEATVVYAIPAGTTEDLCTGALPITPGLGVCNCHAGICEM